MPAQPPLPPLLTPYLSPPESSLNVISSVLAATGNWLVLRFLYATLSASPGSGAVTGIDGSETGKKRKVVLLSFLRNWDFWRSEAKKLGLDLARLADKGLFAYIDGLSELFYAPANASAASTQSGAIPIRSTGPAPTRTPQPAPGPGNTSPKPSTEPGVARRLHFSGNGTAALDGLERDIVSVINQLKSTGDSEDESEVVLIVDQPDLLLAATGPSRGIGATEMTEWVMGLQQVSLQSGYV
ncbi:hypothetical protein PHISP_07755 [Aspergillus sp. HF37]|nr:hypothetical protein PHISP_07755 [Aspergillus sp. HF37]